jgi:hypothetical protein
MKAHDALKHFKAFMADAGLSLDNLSPQNAVDLMVNFYTQIPTEDCTFENDGDMLLFEWGMYNWGNGEFFEHKITRQFIPSTSSEEECSDDLSASSEEECSDDWIGQLSLTLKYPPSPVLKTIASGNLWCAHPDEIPDFINFIQTCEATKQITDLSIMATELTFSNAE